MSSVKIRSYWLILGWIIVGPSLYAQSAPQAADSAQTHRNNVPAVDYHHQVIKVPRLISKEQIPAYPEILRRVGVEGEVRAQFMIDTMGVPEPESIKILDVVVDFTFMKQHTPGGGREPDSIDEFAAKAGFGESVRQTVASMRFSPASLDGHLVRELVELPFDFQMRH